MDFAELTTEHQRLTILRALAADGAGSHNESILQSILAQLGLACGRAKVRTMIAWLQEQGLVTVSGPDSLMVAQITLTGADVASGVSSVPGVQRPAPGTNR